MLCCNLHLHAGLLQVLGVQEEVQLREQDWCQQPELAMRCYNERLARGRFFYRFPEGESAADVRPRGEDGGGGRGRQLTAAGGAQSSLTAAMYLHDVEHA
jgi:hypothetical protein